MFRFWHSVIEPLLETLQPKTILEIGSVSHRNTRNTFEFCRRSGVVLHSIGQGFSRDTDALRDRLQGKNGHHHAQSLPVLPSIPSADLVMIDARYDRKDLLLDLKFFDEAAARGRSLFPFVALYGIGSRSRADRPNVASDQEENDQGNALLDLEKFIAESKHDLQLVKIPGFHGLGMLFPLKILEGNEELARLLSGFTMSIQLEIHTKAIESARLSLENDCKKLKQEIEKLKNKQAAQIAYQVKELDRLISWFDQLVYDIHKLLSSKRWKIGNAIGDIKRKVLFRPRTSMPADKILHLIEVYREWRVQNKQTGISFPLIEAERASDKDATFKTLCTRQTTSPLIGTQTESRPTPTTWSTPSRSYYSHDPRFRIPVQPSTHDKAWLTAVQQAYGLLKNKSFFFILEHLRSSGGPAVVMEIVRQLNRRGYDVGIVCSQIQKHPITDFDVLSLDSTRLKEADAIVATAWKTMLQLNELATRRKLSAQKVLFCQSDEPSWWPPEKKDHPAYPGDKWRKQARKAFLSKGYKHIIISEHMKRFADQYGFEIVGKVRVATPRLSYLGPSPKTSPNGTVGFINRGKTAWYKGRDDCLSALSLLQKRKPHLTIRSIGFDPPDYDITQMGIIYQQNPTDSQIDEFYNNIDVFLSTSYIEGCPLPQQEAMWCGCPVVTTPIGLQGEYDRLGSESTCIVVEAGNVLEMANAVDSLLNDATLWNKFRYLGLRGIAHRSTIQMIDDFMLSLGKAIQ